MKRQILISLSILLLVAGFAKATDLPYKQGELLVRFTDTGARSPIRKVISGPMTTRAVKSTISNLIVTGTTVHKEYDRVSPGLTLVKLPEGMTVQDALFQFNLSPSVLYAEPNYKYKLCANYPDDPKFDEQWALDNTGQTGGTPDADIDAPEAWDIHTGVVSINPDDWVIVAVTDTGISSGTDYENFHEDLADNMWINPGEDMPEVGVVDVNDFNEVDDDLNDYIDDIHGWDFAGDSVEDIYDGDNDPTDYMFHGTHVAGIIGAVGNNSIGVTGVCWNVKLMALKIFADDSEEVGALTTDIIEAIEYAIDMGANVINASWGSYSSSQSLYDAISNANDAGILFVASAGNDGIDNDFSPVYPASYDLDNVISVMATDHYDTRSIWGMGSASNYGAASVHLAAPGTDIFSTLPTELTDFMIEEGLFPNYGAISGTSMAAPFVSGACALMWSINPTLTHIEVKKMLLHSVDKLPALQGLCVSGGRLNLFTAMKMASPTDKKVLNVDIPKKFDSIQAAIDYPGTNNGHELIAHKDDWYFENINFKGKKVMLRSGDIDNPGDTTIWPENTFISGLLDTGRIVTIDNGQDADTVLKGFTIESGAGGIYCNNTSPTITDCIITENTAGWNGGGIYCENNADPNIIDCTISNNTATNAGGGIYCNNASDSNITDCTISNNIASDDGGGIGCSDSSPTVTNCNITGNTTEWEGGGIYCDSSSPTINNCKITGNRAEFEGGGIHCDNGSDPNITNNTISNNTAQDDGGGIGCYDSSPQIKNCLIIDNTVDSWDGGGIYLDTSSPEIINCTIAGNSASEDNPDALGGGLLCSFSSNPIVTNCIFSDNNDYAIAVYYYEYGDESVPNVTYCLFYNNLDGDYCDYDDVTYPATVIVYTGADEINDLSNASNNIDGDPLFVRGRLGYYYLSQIAAGQLNDSNAVDAGSDTAANLGMDLYSTRTDTVADSGTVDIGYHYDDPVAPVNYNLTTFIIGNGSVTLDPPGGTYIQYAQVFLEATAGSDSQFKSWSGTDDDTRTEPDNIVTMDSHKTVTVTFETLMVWLHTRVLAGESGTIYPRKSRAYARGTVVPLTATPDNPSYVIIWNGTDDDYSTSRNNIVTMIEPFTLDSHGRESKEVEVEFYAPQTFYVGAESSAMTIQLAIDNAHDRDIIVFLPGTYNIYESSEDHPRLEIDDKPVTMTSTNPDDPCCVAATHIIGGFAFWNVGRDTIINGLTITGHYSTFNGCDGMDETCGNPYPDGMNGGSHTGGGMRLNWDASPAVRNCVFLNCSSTAGHGGNGNADGDIPGDGGWGGTAYGGGAYCGPYSSPIFENCSFIDCWARGGDGGNGSSNPTGHGGSWGDKDSPRWFWGPYDDYWKYSGYGGAIYCDNYSTAEFVDCTFTDNHVYGGSCGISGTPTPSGWPTQHYRIDRFGGAAYCAASSSPTFTGCSFTDNVVPDVCSPYYNGPQLWHEWEGGENEPTVATYPYLAYGGAVAFEDGATPFFDNCTFNGNLANIGGAMYWEWGSPLIGDCSFVGNSAYHGGATLFVGGITRIVGSNFSGNEATGPIAQGGAICSLGANAEIIDCDISNNDANGSGGGIYISSKDVDGSDISSGDTVLVKNCLITNNIAVRDGGGISANWYSDPNIVNCTIANNMVTGDGFDYGYGGGVYCCYGNYTNIINSIIWGSLAGSGSQLAVGTSFEYDPRPSTVNVSYSAIGPRYAYLGFGSDGTFAGGLGQGGGTTLVEGQTIYDQFDAGQDRVKVIVSLFEPVEMRQATDWDSPESVSALRAEIANRQSSVLSTLTADEFTLRYQYENQAGFSGEVTIEGFNELLSNPLVAYIEPVRYVRPMLAQAIPLANALEARQVYDGTGIAVAIVDTGVDYTHLRLGNNGFPNDKVIGGYDTGENDDDPMPVGEAHGTCCAGIAAGDLGTVGDYIGGVAPGAKIYALKASLDYLDSFADDALLAAWDWCVTHRNDDPDNPIKVVSNSWGIWGLPFNDPEEADNYSPAMTTAAESTVAAGITILAASGNDYFAGDGISWPSAMSKVISVGAVYDTTDAVTGYSNTADNLDILAPAEPMYTTDIVGAGGYDTGDYFPYFNGTSSSCPFAAGAVASLQSAALAETGGYLTPAGVRYLLITSGDPVTDTKVAITKPRVNLGVAINYLTSGPIYIEEDCTVDRWDPESQSWDPDSHNLDIDDDPCFVDGYYLSQVAAGQDVDSNCVDAGKGSPADLGLQNYTTRTDSVRDACDVDMGYHYPLIIPEASCDFDADGDVDLADLAILLSYWLEDRCDLLGWCEGTDLDRDTDVDFVDYAIFAQAYGAPEGPPPDTDPPEPDPSEWAIEPHPLSSSEIHMKAETAYDPSGGVQYQFECVGGGGHSSDWQDSPEYVDTGLAPLTEYCYTVRTRDKYDNRTEPSVERCVSISDVTPPQPDPSEWAIEPHPLSSSEIHMKAETAYDPSGGVQYQFECVGGGGHSSDWQDSPEYVDTGLAPLTEYTYRVRTRDVYNNIGDYSEPQSATTLP